MPSPLSFLSVDTAPAQANATCAPDHASGEPGVSFATVLNEAAPCSGKSPGRASIKGSARADVATAKAPKSAEDTSTEAVSSEEPSVAEKPAPLSAQELAALLALIGAPAALQQPPPPTVPIGVSFTGGTRLSVSDEVNVNIEAEASFAAQTFSAGKTREAPIPRTPAAPTSELSATFTLGPAATGEGLTARDLLKQGLEVIGYQLTSASPPATAPAEGRQPSDTTSFASGLELPPETLVTPETLINAPALPSHDDVAAKAQSPAPAEAASGTQSKAAAVGQAVEASSARAVVAQKAASKATAEKFAATTESRELRTVSGVKPSIVSEKYNFLNVDGKGVKSAQAEDGTGAANWGVSMNLDARPIPAPARFADGALWSIEGASGNSSNVERGVESSAPKAATAPHAAQIVSEIRDIADGLWAVERNSVEVRFNFSENERLSVKVEYRDGVVQTTFRTDSPELRDTIAREWQSQIASASEARPYRVADPVFNTPPADARGFSLGGDSSRQQRQAEQSGNAPHTFATTSGRGPSSSSVTAAPVTSFSRPDTALHLHTFA
jgi:hypothetical protein